MSSALPCTNTSYGNFTNSLVLKKYGIIEYRYVSFSILITFSLVELIRIQGGSIQV